MVELDTIEHLLMQQMLNGRNRQRWLCSAASNKPVRSEPGARPSSQPLSQSVKCSQSYFFENREQAPSQFGVSARRIKVFNTQPFLREISAEIHLAVRKQLLFVEASGWCNFNFKDVLNELPPRDWWAVRNVPPVPTYTPTEGFNYEPSVLMLSAPVWYASCTVCVKNGLCHLVASTAEHRCLWYSCSHSSV